MKQRTWKHKDSAKIRQFTRKEVEDCFHKFWGAAIRATGDTVTIEKIARVPEMTPPTWRVDFCIQGITGFCYHDAVLVIQRSWITGTGLQGFYLTAPKEQTLPEGCASVKDEDARLRQQRCSGAAQDEEES
jgi:hypothetical protein